VTIYSSEGAIAASQDCCMPSTCTTVLAKMTMIDIIFSKPF